MPLVVTQLPSVYGKKSQSNRSSLPLRHRPTTYGKEGYTVMMHPQLKINEVLFYITFGNTILECT